MGRLPRFDAPLVAPLIALLIGLSALWSVPGTARASEASGEAPGAAEAAVTAPGTTPFALGTSRLFPSRYAPSAIDLAGAALHAVETGNGIDNVIIEMPPAGGRISGRILGSGEEGLVGVRVAAQSGTFEVIGLTGPDGSFSLEGVPSGEVYLRASTDNPNSREQRYAARYYPDALSRESASPLQLTEAQSFELPNWTLPLGSTLRGQVIGRDTEGPVRDVEVRLHRNSDGRIWQRRTDMEGRFAFRGLTPGSYRVGAVPDRGTRYLPAWSGGVRTLPEAKSLQLKPAGEESVSLLLDPGASIRGQLRSEGQNLPLPQLLVQAISQETREVYETISDDLGFFELSGIPAGSGDAYFVYCPPMFAYHPGVSREEDARRLVVVEGETTARIDITGFDPRGCILGGNSRGVIRGSVAVDFSKLEGGLVIAYSEEDTVRQELTEGGLFTMDCVPVGEYKIGFLPQGPFVTQYFDEVDDLGAAEYVTVDADTADGIRFDPPRASWIAGVVRETGGTPVPAATVTILDRDGRALATGLANEFGSFRIERIEDGSGLPAGEYYVRAESTVVADPEVTPVLQPTISYDVEDDTVLIWWSLVSPWWWELALYRTNLETGETVRLWHEPARPEALSEWEDRPGPGRYRYRLGARAFSTEGVPESPWIEVWTETADLGARLSPGAWPSPWNGSGRITFGGAAAAQFEEGLLEIVSAEGRLVRRLLWPRGEPTLSWDGMDRAGTAVASGVYFARRRTERGAILSTVVMVIQR